SISEKLLKNNKISSCIKNVAYGTNSRQIEFLSFFKDQKKIAIALFECLIDNDVEAFIEILDSYLRINRRRVVKGAHLARSTVQLALSGKGNRTIKTLAKIVNDAVAA